MNRLLIAAACAAALSLASTADAAVTISGFGQVVVGTTGDDAEPFPERNFDSDADFKEESLFAVQVSADSEREH
jgi:opacity protein-like surface antigen